MIHVKDYTLYYPNNYGGYDGCGIGYLILLIENKTLSNDLRQAALVYRALVNTSQSEDYKTAIWADNCWRRANLDSDDLDVELFIAHCRIKTKSLQQPKECV